MRPAIVLLSLSIWGSLMGIIGMIIALPLTVVLLAYYKRFILMEEMEPDTATVTTVTETEKQEEKPIPEKKTKKRQD